MEAPVRIPLSTRQTAASARPLWTVVARLGDEPFVRPGFQSQWDELKNALKATTRDFGSDEPLELFYQLATATLMDAMSQGPGAYPAAESWPEFMMTL